MTSNLLCQAMIAILLRSLSATALNVVDLRHEVSPADELAVRVCAGLLNRDDNISESMISAGGGGVYTLEGKRDEVWLREVHGHHPHDGGDLSELFNVLTPKMFLPLCLSSDAVQGRYVRYDYVAQRAILPNIVTVAGVTDSVPLEDAQVEEYSNDALFSKGLLGLFLAFDALNVLGGSSPAEATAYVFDKGDWLSKTTANAKMNPGWRAEGLDNLSPTLSGHPELGLVDLVVKNRLFAYFLWFGCIDGTQEEELLSRMTDPSNNPWPNPIPVWGYDNSWNIAGSIWEANTFCSDEMNMGSVPSLNTTNLSFFSKKDPITAPLQTVHSPDIVYNADKTYLALIVGDGDNLAYIKGNPDIVGQDRRAWMEERVERCQANPNSGCFPLVWSMSPQLLRSGPDLIRWYYEKAAITGRDSFVLPPSGHLYSYPSSMAPSARDEFVRLTEDDARLMGTNGMVGWEVASSWGDALDNYFPRYTANNVIQAVFAVNVPYLLPIVTTLFTDTFKVVEGSLVLFKPSTWRGTDGRDKFHKPANEMAAEINDFPGGSVNHIYATADGGFKIADVYDLVQMLGDHVQIVDSRQLADLALQKSRLCSGPWWCIWCC